MARNPGSDKRWWEARHGGSRGEEGTVDLARHLSTVARRFVNGRANRAEVEEAIGMWRAECEKRWPSAPPASEHGGGDRCAVCKGSGLGEVGSTTRIYCWKCGGTGQSPGRKP